MKLYILYFAQLRDSLKIAEEGVVVPAHICNVSALMLWLSQRGERWGGEFSGSKQLRAAVNQLLASSDAIINNGDEVAFFPPMTGG